VAHALGKRSIVISQSDVARLLQAKAAIAAGILILLKQIGYAHVTLDLQGYRRGSANEAIKPPAAQEQS
jgi:uncharacterized 2Fe-2S/4Fe-4S cluster protein (DUF4445 family)